MKTFFVLLAIVGAILMWLQHAAETTSDSIPAELASYGALGAGFIVIGVVGFHCVWLLP